LEGAEKKRTEQKGENNIIKRGRFIRGNKIHYRGEERE